MLRSRLRVRRTIRLIRRWYRLPVEDTGLVHDPVRQLLSDGGYKLAVRPFKEVPVPVGVVAEDVAASSDRDEVGAVFGQP